MPDVIHNYVTYVAEDADCVKLSPALSAMETELPAGTQYAMVLTGNGTYQLDDTSYSNLHAKQ